MKINCRTIQFFIFFCIALVLVSSCSKKDVSSPPPVIILPPPPPPPPPPAGGFDINSITDTYDNIAPFNFYTQWSVYNVHDPSIRKFGDYYYSYSTDVGYGIGNLRPGLQVRKSKDLVE